MKDFLLLKLACLLPAAAAAQNCGGYYYLKQNGEVQVTAYDRKAQAGSVITYTVSGVEQTPKGLQAKLHSSVRDPQGREEAAAEGVIRCEGGRLLVDMQTFLPAGSLDQFRDMDIKTEPSYLVYPDSMHSGQQLPDGRFHMDVSRNGSKYAEVDYEITGRRVEGQESVTTPAGTWECFRISYEAMMRIKIGIGIPVRSRVTEWYAPGFGPVKAVQFDKKGKTMGRSELTAVRT